jgi:hypothetical protein
VGGVAVGDHAVRRPAEGEVVMVIPLTRRTALAVYVDRAPRRRLRFLLLER